MIFAFYLLLGLAVAGIAVAVGLRTLVFTEKRAADELHAPGAQTLSYVVPEGQDPAVLTTQLHAAGFMCVAETHGSHQVLLVGCSDAPDRQRVRELIERVHATTFVDSATFDVGHVTFTDEA